MLEHLPRANSRLGALPNLGAAPEFHAIVVEIVAFRAAIFASRTDFDIGERGFLYASQKCADFIVTRDQGVEPHVRILLMASPSVCRARMGTPGFKIFNL